MVGRIVYKLVCGCPCAVYRLETVAVGSRLGSTLRRDVGRGASRPDSPWEGALLGDTARPSTAPRIWPSSRSGVQPRATSISSASPARSPAPALSPASPLAAPARPRRRVHRRSLSRRHQPSQRLHRPHSPSQLLRLHPNSRPASSSRSLRRLPHHRRFRMSHLHLHPQPQPQPQRRHPTPYPLPHQSRPSLSSQILKPH